MPALARGWQIWRTLFGCTSYNVTISIGIDHSTSTWYRLVKQLAISATFNTISAISAVYGSKRGLLRTLQLLLEAPDELSIKFLAVGVIYYSRGTPVRCAILGTIRSASSSTHTNNTPQNSPVGQAIVSRHIMANFSFELLQLPSDLLTYIVREHLPPVPAVALSLTCKDAFKLLLPLFETKGWLPFSDSQTKAEFCELLERDVGDKYYFCPICRTLHPFSPTDGPASSDWASPNTPDCRRCRWTLGASGFTMGLHHVRLALNRQLFGPASGISLDRFQLEHYMTSQTAFQCFHEKWSAKIIDGDLFLGSVRTTSWDIPYNKFLNNLWNLGYKLCEHTLLYYLPTTRPRGNVGSSIEECKDLLGHCRQCFTDWTITAAFIEPRWHLTIHTYHRFPSNRRPQSSGSSAGGRFGYETEVIPLYRDAGLVRDIWLGRATQSARAGRWIKAGVFGDVLDYNHWNE
ncbi:hypothetical protein N657DRAFT_632033 [Parathielavia appendiculata]|uniref:F-box domain-containing protein n=1 Tax=Parathielavia appendiculata TaxID=2587402 RepID=A0AAN6U3R5_9PEZI|nr:hypothetical protein N657DRAFT_632033 [Parathielavia appendiculata]